ncbi:MAG: hypothetical protein NT001_02025, partial [Candidatus Woesearchaeota archaeon]|nr:hypothetical protein [Candidatus Woesearchaeota archaeon]
GVTDAVAVHAQLQDTDICKINVGASEIILENDQEVQVNAKDVAGTNVRLMNDTTGGLAKINITWVPDDKTYVPVGSSLADPVFGNFEYKFASVSKKTEEMSLITSSNDATFTFLNNDGKEVEIPYYMNGTASVGPTNVIMGDDYSAADCDGRLLLEGDNCDSTGFDKGAIEGVKFLLVTSGKEAHVMQIGSITSDNKTTIKDITYAKNYEDKVLNLSSGGGMNPTSIDLGSLGTIGIGIDVAAGVFNASKVNLATGKTIETKYGANISFDSTYGGGVAFNSKPDNGTIHIGEETDESNAYRWTINMTYYATDDELRINAPVLTASPNAGTIATALSASKADRNTKYYVSEWGTKATYDSDTKNSLVLEYPDEEVYANVFVAPIGATVSGAGGESSTVTLNPINVGSAKLASEIAGQEKTQNLILIGGPCANEAAKVIMGATDDCTAGFESGKAMIKLYENGGNVAMVVAGFSAADTRRATTVIAKYADYASKLTGTEVVVSGTSLSDITVSAPSS